METPKTLQQAIIYFSEPKNCDQFMTMMRWPDGQVRCPRCGSEKVTYLEKARVWKCYSKHPKAKFSLKVGTIFEDSPLGLDKWFTAMWLIANCKNGISSYELGRHLGITQKAAWHVNHRIRLAMQNGSLDKLSGFVEVDETFIGGAARNMHKGRRKAQGTVENYWSLLKRAIKGTYVSVEPFHLFRYLDEQAYRFNKRTLTDFQRFVGVVEMVTGKRLEYRQLIGRPSC